MESAKFLSTQNPLRCLGFVVVVVFSTKTSTISMIVLRRVSFS